jgi:hypothetical protein
VAYGRPSQCSELISRIWYYFRPQPVAFPNPVAAAAFNRQPMHQLPSSSFSCNRVAYQSAAALSRVTSKG